MNSSDLISSLKLCSTKCCALLVQHRMRSTRILIAIVLFVLLCTIPGIEEGSATELLMDWIGYFLIIAACLGRVFSSIFICGTKNDKLSCEGPFTLVRNPLYVFSFLGIIGSGFLSGRIILLALLVGIFFLYYPEVVAHEEAFLSDKFGKEYADYQQKVPRWIPTQWTMTLPETFTVYPSLLLNTIRDSALFFLVYPSMELIECLHTSEAIPNWFTLY